jgi:hypothetical protein
MDSSRQFHHEESHVLVPLILHLTDVMEAVEVLWLQPVGVPYCPYDFLEVIF